VGGEETGPIPKPLVLAALSGCTGMDVVALLRKSGFTVNEFCLDITGELSKQQPLEYVSIHLVYDCKGNEAVKDALLRAVSDSQEKICGVSHMLKKAMPVTWEIRFNDRELFNNRFSPAVTHLI
jgi:putative redox protein